MLLLRDRPPLPKIVLFVLLTVVPACQAALSARIIADFDVAKSNINMFASPIDYVDGALYTAYVEPPDGISTGVNHRTVVRKGVPKSSGIWKWDRSVIDTETLDDRYHTQPSIALDKRGYVHVAYNMHNMPWQYAISNKPKDIAEFTFRGERLSTAERVAVKHANRTPFPTLGEAVIPGNQVTYPRFFKDRNNDLYLTYRFATKPKRHFKERGYAGGAARYDVASKTWTSIGAPIEVTAEDAELPDGVSEAQVRPLIFTDKWTVYLIQLVFDKNNTMHLSWMWREGGAGRDTSHPSYAYSDDSGLSFKKSSGVLYSLPISQRASDIVWPQRAHKGYAAKNSLAVDSQGRPHVVVHRLGETRKLISLDPASKTWSKPENMPQSAAEIFFDREDRLWAIATGPVLMRKDKGKDDWITVLNLSDSDNRFGFPTPLYVEEENKLYLHTQSVSSGGRVRIYEISL